MVNISGYILEYLEPIMGKLQLLKNTITNAKENYIKKIFVPRNLKSIVVFKFFFHIGC